MTMTDDWWQSLTDWWQWINDWLVTLRRLSGYLHKNPMAQVTAVMRVLFQVGFKSQMTAITPVMRPGKKTCYLYLPSGKRFPDLTSCVVEGDYSILLCAKAVAQCLLCHFVLIWHLYLDKLYLIAEMLQTGAKKLWKCPQNCNFCRSRAL